MQNPWSNNDSLKRQREHSLCLYVNATYKSAAGRPLAPGCAGPILTKGGECISEHKKLGRPTDHPKTTMFRVRLDDETIQKLEESAQLLESTKSDVVRKGINLVYQSLKK